MRKGLAVPFTRWELATWLFMGAAAIVNVAFATSIAGWIGGGFVLVALLFAFFWVYRLHQRSPAFFAQDAPVEFLWFVGLGAVIVGALALSAPALEDKLWGALFALGLVCVIINERTRARPDAALTGEMTGGGSLLIGPTTAAGLTRRRRIGEAVFAVLLLVYAVIAIVVDSSWGIFGFICTMPALVVWELGWRLTKKRKLGYFAALRD